ncbi:MAG: glycosyl transferase [Microbacterium sp. SCN 70-27]|uniref:glycosyl transferase n=1 Tax=unclassified Microbacterium TaxID=2609290 RepID=UPI00086EF6F0|nr:MULTISPECIES: glycosyl transferase [unclassified Microbacterium]MBN9223455.1 glycosyl transferase [Microbacterium sp.]ODT28671.1 MAG: glycosyl transferase [Microbacterium sp. SCN 70-27]
MRFVWAVAAFVLAALMIGAGIAQRTVFEGPKSESETISVPGDAPYILIDGAVLNSHAGSQTLRVEGADTIFAAYGRTADLKAWLQKADYTDVAVTDGKVGTTPVRQSVRLAEGESALTPQGSDLWLEEFSEKNVLTTPLQLPEDMSMLVASDGVAAAPHTLTLTWPIDHATPWAGPLIVGGALVLAGGIVLYVLGVRHVRRSRGPRRKGLPVPVTEPIDLAVDGADKGVISATPTRRQLTRGRRTFAVVPVVAVSALLFSGCSADAWPQFTPSATPSPTRTVVAPKDQESPVVTEAQAERIVAQIATTVAAADEARDATAAASRLAGTALAVRETNYVLRGALPDLAALPAVPTGKLEVTLPEANDNWPRTFLAVAPAATGDGKVMMSVTQNDAWSDYKLTYTADLTSNTALNLAPPYVGAISIPLDSPFLAISPEKLAGAYADVLTKGADSEFASLFDREDDVFQTTLEADRASRLEAFNQTGAQTGTMTFSSIAGTSAPSALATLDSGAIVAVTVDDLDTVKPTSADAVIKVDGDPGNKVVQTLSGVTQSSTGFVSTYANQLFFFVPSQSSKERIQLLGFSSQILDAKAAP